MVIPARWYSGGRGLDEFRDEILSEGKIAELHDFPETELVFPNVTIRGGVCYFRWTKDHKGATLISNHSKDHPVSISTRLMLEKGLTTFVRYNEAISILKKVRKFNENTYDQRVLSQNPFGLRSNFSDFSTIKTKTKSILLFRSRRGSSADKEVYVSEDQILSNSEYKNRTKVLVSKASPGGDEYPHSVFSSPIVSPINTISTETYLIVDFAKTIDEANNLVNYMKTRFFRFLISLIKSTQNISKSSFAFVPIQDLTINWTDAELYKKYGITKEEQGFIEKMIRPMNNGAENDKDD
jgi:site-specific DNA-methyltransferase (adenine-specific)